jgi:hypothetical protein
MGDDLRELVMSILGYGDSRTLLQIVSSVHYTTRIFSWDDIQNCLHQLEWERKVTQLYSVVDGDYKWTRI